MEEPTLDALRGAGDTSGIPATEDHSLGQKIAAAVGIAFMGGYIGYSLVYNQQAGVPQALWSREDENHEPVSTVLRPRLALVNMSDGFRLCAMAGLRAWLDVEDEVELEFPTVTFIEEEEAAAIAGLAAEARRAALFAWAELKERSEMSESLALKPLCCVVYRTITEVDGEALDDWDVQKTELARWHGKRFVTRHCVGVSVNGKHAMVLMHDIEGIVDVGPPSTCDDVCISDCGALARRYGAPCASSFHRWRLSAETHSSLATGQPTPKLLQGLGARPQDGQRCQLWQSPLHLFAALGAVLRYSRTDAVVYPDYITTPVLVPQNGSAVRASWWCRMQRLARRCASPLLRRYTARQSELVERQRQLSSTFVVDISLAEKSASVTSDMLRVVEEYVVEWMRDMSGTPRSKASVQTAHRVCAHGTAVGAQKLKLSPVIRVDLTDIVCNVLAAEWLLIRLVSLFAALGLSPARAQLVAVPEPQASASLLYPTPNSPQRQHLWLSRLTPHSVSRSADRYTRTLCMTPTACTTQQGRFPACATSDGRESGYVVSEHDFSCSYADTSTAFL
ncbi:hypothetical protein LSCM4_02328 [Leishmania orientalis]|uniref:Uncharacterized protein n=1 Tax=Leishmania orientalis TaxID=2249476 RepID=A0A836KFJ3_9TRYP|nr:hypothetical protein LSCM4_02328 [Leishmania orientalis]